MGTNYYATVEIESTENHVERFEKIHIGKRSAASKDSMLFSFSNYKPTLIKWIEYLSTNDNLNINDEYGREFSSSEMIEIINNCSSFKFISCDFA